jgi:hypothetical protein
MGAPFCSAVLFSLRRFDSTSAPLTRLCPSKNDSTHLMLLETLVSCDWKSLASVRDSTPLVTSVRKLSVGARDVPAPARHSSRPVFEMRRFHCPFRRSSDDA